MFVGEKTSLAETRQRLETDGFLVTKAQLEYKLKLWGFRRRVPKTKSNAVWQFIGRRIQRRKEQGKETEVALGKEIFDAAKVCKEIKRYQETTIAQLSQPSPMTPEGLEISLNTPAPLPMRFLWPTSLPWSKFSDRFSLVASAPGLLNKMNNTSKELRYRNEDPSFTKVLRFVAPHYQTGSSVTQLAAEIGTIMPETQENENLVRARRLLQGTADERHSECVKIVLYKLSNNLLSVDENSDREWQIITEMLEASGIMKAPLQPRDITDATMAAIMERLFERAMQSIMLEPPNNSLEKSSHGRIITWLLQSGQNPDVRIYYDMEEELPWGFS
ncbi:Dynein heavy chain 12, axonemal [Colletotrichum sp. SAR 10_99]|nr:Dynein heavy chain 12, axonemal [Colletotrichum sp. SAR 10_96]KAJ5011982.1 Dynein heavy chain 12, axonemal [Colletotrichum sp. SAR 10_99]